MIHDFEFNALLKRVGYLEDLVNNWIELKTNQEYRRMELEKLLSQHNSDVFDGEGG